MTAEKVVSFLLEEEGVDFLRESLRWVVQQLMEAEVSELIGAERGERSPERLTHRNGYRQRAWQTRAGEIELAIPKIRRGSYFPSSLEPRKRSEQALVAVVQEPTSLASRLARSTSWSSHWGCGSRGVTSSRVSNSPRQRGRSRASTLADRAHSACGRPASCALQRENIRALSSRSLARSTASKEGGIHLQPLTTSVARSDAGRARANRSAGAGRTARRCACVQRNRGRGWPGLSLECADASGKSAAGSHGVAARLSAHEVSGLDPHFSRDRHLPRQGRIGIDAPKHKALACACCAPAIASDERCQAVLTGRAAKRVVRRRRCKAPVSP
jgi:Transposase, Mutator family